MTVQSLSDIPAKYHDQLQMKLKNVRVTDRGCWEWQGSVTPIGYGKVGAGKYLVISTHRLAWMMFRGEIGAGLNVLHRCDNRPCINPDHLWLGTLSDNCADMVSKGRHRGGGVLKTACPLGHPYDARDKTGKRFCRACRRESQRRYEQKVRGARSAAKCPAPPIPVPA